VGFATFDNQIQFYSLRAGQAQPQMLVIPDAADPYCPLPQSLLAPLKANIDLTAPPPLFFPTVL